MAYPKKTPEERAQDMENLSQKLVDGTQELYTSGQYADYLKKISSFTDYSARNALLILLQMPTASLVAGYRTWKNKHHRQVVDKCKIYIIAPCGPHEVVEQNVLHPRTLEPIHDREGNALRETVDHGPSRFMRVPVWDISQTEGEEIPLAESKFDLAAIPDKEKWVGAFREIAGCPVILEDENDSAPYDPEEVIYIPEGLSDSGLLYSMAREIAASRIVSIREQDDLKQTAIEASSIAYMVSAQLGIDGSADTFADIAIWSKDKDAKVLLRSLDFIKKQAQEMVTDLEEAMSGKEVSRGTADATRKATLFCT